MESSSSENLPGKRIKAIEELTQGQILTNRLQEMLDQSEKIESNIELVDDILVQILGMFENTLAVLSSSNKIPCNQAHHMTSPDSWDDQTSTDSIKSIKTRRGCYKRKKSSSIFTNVTFNLVDDGYAWRKYGQKVILNSKHPRHYYRCSHKFERGCQATKQVQMTNDKPPKYKITYHQHHTCNNLQILDSPNPRGNSFLLSFETNTLIERKQAGPFPSTTRHKPNEGFPSLSIKHDKVSSSDNYTTWSHNPPKFHWNPSL